MVNGRPNDGSVNNESPLVERGQLARPRKCLVVVIDTSSGDFIALDVNSMVGKIPTVFRFRQIGY